MGSKLTVSGFGQADDVLRCSNDIYLLYNLLQLALDFARNVVLSSVLTRPSFNPIVIDVEQIGFSDQAEHVGIIRSAGNIPNLMNINRCSKKATNATLACGLARGHRSNPAACIRVMNLYGTPVLMSGLGSLVLSPTEIYLLHQDPL